MDEILSDLKLLIAEVRKTVLYSPDQQRTWFSIEEAAELLGKSPYTVREWCRAGRINARKTGEKRGSAEVWRISAQEMTRLREDGLLEPDFHRNRRSEV
jgi:excisionase family DNA binding protein